ncbi:penicillin acylase family protein, partial [Streptomyces massasporeus]
MRANKRFWVAATVCAAVVAGATGCSQGEDKAADPFAGLTADAIAEKGVETTKTATALHMSGSGKTEGEDMKTDFTLDSKGSCKGTMTASTGKGGKAEILRTGGFTYMKGDESFWRSTGGTGETPGGVPGSGSDSSSGSSGSSDGSGAQSQLGALSEVLDGVPALLGPNGNGIGSNSWVVSGQYTTSGKPLLANDPHLAPQLPSLWYQMGLHCRSVSATCRYDV